MAANGITLTKCGLLIPAAASGGRANRPWLSWKKLEGGKMRAPIWGR